MGFTTRSSSSSKTSFSLAYLLVVVILPPASRTKHQPPFRCLLQHTPICPDTSISPTAQPIPSLSKQPPSISNPTNPSIHFQPLLHHLPNQLIVHLQPSIHSKLNQPFPSPHFPSPYPLFPPPYRPSLFPAPPQSNS